MKIVNVDGITQLSEPLKEYQALSLITQLDLKEEIKPFTTENSFNYAGVFKNMVLTLRKRHGDDYYLTVTGSIHKSIHSRNDNDLYEDELQLATKEISDYLQIDIVQFQGSKSFKNDPAIKYKLSKVEIAVNFFFPADDLQKFLKDNLLLHKKERFSNEDGLTFICKHENYYLKIYPKGTNLIRIELVLLSKELVKYKIVTLEDLTFDKVAPVFERIKKEAKEIIFADGIDIHSPKNLTKKEKLRLLTYTNEWWRYCLSENLKACKNKQEKRKLSNEIYRFKKATKKVFENKGAGYKQIFLDYLNAKIDSILLVS